MTTGLGSIGGGMGPGALGRLGEAWTAVDVAARGWWEWFAPVSLQLGVLVVIVVVIERLLSRWAWPGLSTALWMVVVVRLVLPPTLSSPVSVAHLAPDQAVSLLGTPPASSELAPIAFALWATGLIGWGLQLVWRHRSLGRVWLGPASRPAPGAVVRVAARAAHRLGLRRVPEVRLHPGVSGAAVVGVRRPVVVLPTSLAEGSAAEHLEHVLLHELAHIRRRDPLMSQACLALQLVWWFHPLVWVARRRLSALREIGCDQAVARALRGETGPYRRTLLELARPQIEGAAPAPTALGFLLPHRALLLTRLEWLERPLSGRPLMRRLASAALTVVLAMCCMPLSRSLDRAMPPIVPSLPDLTLDDLEGCLQLRYAVFGRMARGDAAAVAPSTAASADDG